MALSSLRHDADGYHNENRGGYIIYSGDAMKFHEWEFKTRMRVRTAKAEDRLKVVQEIVDSLRGEAASIAMDLGTDTLCGRDGIEELIGKIQKLVFPMKRHEANAFVNTPLDLSNSGFDLIGRFYRLIHSAQFVYVCLRYTYRF